MTDMTLSPSQRGQDGDREHVKETERYRGGEAEMEGDGVGGRRRIYFRMDNMELMHNSSLFKFL